MPETRYIDEYDNNGNVINKIPYEVSDEELELEAAEKAIDELSALKDDDLTIPQAARFLKALAKLRR